MGKNGGVERERSMKLQAEPGQACDGFGKEDEVRRYRLNRGDEG